MIELYSNNITTAVGATVPLNNVAFKKGCSVTNSGSSSILFNKCGVYEVTVNISASSATATTGALNFGLSVNGVNVPNASSSETIGDATSIHALSFKTLVAVPSNNSNCCCVKPTTCSIVNNGVSANIQIIDVVVSKIC